MRGLWGIFVNRTTRKEPIMSKRSTEKSRAALEAQQQSGAHKPATQCECGTWRTPGQAHTEGTAGPRSPDLMTRMCTK
jgi:hypothetical protein